MTIAALTDLCSRVPGASPLFSKSGVVRVFHAGPIEATLIPELWLLDRPHTQRSVAAGAIETQRLGRPAPSPSEMGEES
jgi:hypothetical protein